MRTRAVVVSGSFFLVCGISCAPPSQPKAGVSVRAHNQNLVQTAAILARVGKFAEGSFYACMLNGYMQGLPLHQVSDECASKLMEDDGKGFGGPLGNIGRQEIFDPGKVSLACNAGDPRVSQPPGQALVPGHGSYSWGGDDINKYYQYTKEQSEQKKFEAIRRAGEEGAEFVKLEKAAELALFRLKEAKKSGNAAAIDAAQFEYDQALNRAQEQGKKSETADEEADADPNLKPFPNARPGDESPCDQALDAARTVLRECTRTDWKDPRCQRLQARVNGCPDPVLIYVDPEQGYACGAKPDAEAVKNAWVKRCEQKVRYGPETSNPCIPPAIDGSGRFGRGPIGDVCNDPHAYLNPESNDCAGTFVLTGVSQPTVTEVAVWGMNRIGGPIIVLPTRTPVPPRGPDPGPPPSALATAFNGFSPARVVHINQ